MAFDGLPISVIDALWTWAKGNIGQWVAALKDLRAVVAEPDLADPNSLISAAQFSAFPVALGQLLSFPYHRVAGPQNYGLEDLLEAVILVYILLVICALGQFVFSRLVGGRGSLSAALIVSFYASSYDPIIDALIFIDPISDERLQYLRDSVGDLSQVTARELTLGYAVAALGLYATFKVTSAVAFVQKVGRLRGFVICCGGGLFTLAASWLLPKELVFR
jgi:hypothetical protein